jgi:very-short-patch-repair endonuclease
MEQLRIFTRHEIHALGLSNRQIARAVTEGTLLRPRKGRYLLAGAPADVVSAVGVGGRLTCVSELKRQGVFLIDAPDRVHVHLADNASRLGPRNDSRPKLHWQSLSREPHPQATSVLMVDALIHAVQCLDAQAAVVALDSALNKRLVRKEDLGEIFRALPRRYRRLRRRVDGRAESGTETIVRLMIRSLGYRVELQVAISGVGRVDMIVDGWLVVECDSRAHHSDWETQRADRRRDQKLAQRGYAVYRPIAEDILYHPDEVLRALEGMIGAWRSRSGLR